MNVKAHFDCAAFHNAMQCFTAANIDSSDQHKEEGISRQKHNTKDTMTITSFLRDRNPLIEQEDRRNIETGVTASSDVNFILTKLKVLELTYCCLWKRMK